MFAFEILINVCCVNLLIFIFYYFCFFLFCSTANFIPVLVFYKIAQGTEMNGEHAYSLTRNARLFIYRWVFFFWLTLDSFNVHTQYAYRIYGRQAGAHALAYRIELAGEQRSQVTWDMVQLSVSGLLTCSNPNKFRHICIHIFI